VHAVNYYKQPPMLRSIPRVRKILESGAYGWEI